jgi:ABC-type taurine transport system substrate-binding protein
MLDNGQVLMTGQELESIGLKNFDLVTMSRSFLEVNRETARKFMSITDRFNQQYTAQPGPMKSAIAEGSGIRVMTANRLLQQFSFPAASEQKTVQWLGAGGLVENHLKELAAFLALHENLENPMPGYGNYIDAGLLE